MIEGSLQGLRIVEAGSSALARLTGQLLADHGAEVIHIDAPGVADFRGDATDSAAVSARNKRMATLNLGDERGRNIFLRLLSRSDFLIDGFAAGVLERMGLGWDRLSAENRGLILVRVTHFGQAGPLAGRMGAAAAADAFAGRAGAGVPVSDLMGANSAVMGAMMALYHRMRTGEGQVVDAAAFEPVLALMQAQTVASAAEDRIGGLYTARDGQIAIAAESDVAFCRLAVAVGGPALLSDRRFATAEARRTHGACLRPLVEAYVRQHTLAELEAELGTSGVAFSRLLSPADMRADPHYIARGSLASFPGPDGRQTVTHSPFPKLSATPGRVERMDVPQGHDNDFTYLDVMKLDTDEYQHLRLEGVI